MFLTKSSQGWKHLLRTRPSSYRSLSSQEEPSPDEGPSPSDVAKERRWTKLAAEESQGLFRVLDIGLPKKYDLDKSTKQRRKEFRAPQRKKTDAEWSSVWPAPKTFHPHVVPLPLRQGFVNPREGKTIPDKYANIELMKIPNFLHASPPAIRQHCAAIKKYCTEWPKELDNEAVIERVFPLTKETSDYLNASSSLRDNRSRITTFRFKLSNLYLEPEAKDKIIRLLGTEHLNLLSDEVTIVVDRCPYRKQNSDYFAYLLSALYFESHKVEPWESTKGYLDAIKFDYGSLFSEEETESVEKIENPEVVEVFNVLINQGENSESLSDLKNEVVSKHFGIEPYNP